MSKARDLINSCDSILEEQDSIDTTVANIAKSAGKDKDTVKKALMNIEKGVSKDIPKSNPKFWPVVISTLKKKFNVK